MSLTDLSPLLFPRSVAVVGAGRSGLGRLVLDHLVEGGFEGQLVAVHPQIRSIGSVRAVPTLTDLDGAPDLVVIAVARSSTLEAVRSSAAAGCKAAIVVSAGFAETGSDGIEAQRAMVQVASQHGMRLLGPNCMGLINTDPRARLHASFGVGPALRGPLSLITQSGSVGDYILYHSRRWGLGISLLASVGNEADVTSDELVSVAAKDEATRVIACYLEQPARPGALLGAIRAAAVDKPVVVLLGGRTIDGGAAAASHTGRLARSSGGGSARGLLKAHGAIVVETLEEMMACSVALANHPRGCANRVAVVTNAGGPGVLAVDELSTCGWELVKGKELAPHIDELPPMASTKGTVVDLTASAAPRHFAAAAMAAAGRVDALLCMVMSPEGTDPGPIVEALTTSWRQPLAFSLLARSPEVDRALGHASERNVPAAREPRLAVKALTALRDRQRIVTRPLRSTTSPPPIDRGALETIGELSRRGVSELTLVEGFELCALLGIAVAPYGVANGPEESVEAAMTLGLPVMLKLDVRGLMHKTEAGAVLGPFARVEDVVKAATTLLETELYRTSYDAKILVQRACKGVELILGATKSGSWGLMSVVGMGGVAAEVLEQVAYLPPRACVEEVIEAFEALKLGPLLGRFRGQAPVDVRQAARAAMTIATLASQCRIIYEIEANPFIAVRDSLEPGGVVDLKVVLGRASGEGDVEAEGDDGP